MTILLTVLLVIVCFVLIGAILIQPGEGGDFMSAFAGGSTQVAFGSRGAVTFWTKVVTGAAILFLVLVLSLSIIQGRSGGKSVLPDALPAETTETEAPAETPAADGETPADTPADTPAEEPAAEGDAPADAPAEEPAAEGDAPADAPAEEPAAEGDAPTETPAEEPAA